MGPVEEIGRDISYRDTLTIKIHIHIFVHFMENEQCSQSPHLRDTRSFQNVVLGTVCSCLVLFSGWRPEQWEVVSGARAGSADWSQGGGVPR